MACRCISWRFLEYRYSPVWVDTIITAMSGFFPSTAERSTTFFPNGTRSMDPSLPKPHVSTLSTSWEEKPHRAPACPRSNGVRAKCIRGHEPTLNPFRHPFQSRGVDLNVLFLSRWNRGCMCREFPNASGGVVKSGLSEFRPGSSTYNTSTRRAKYRAFQVSPAEDPQTPWRKTRALESPRLFSTSSNRRKRSRLSHPGGRRILSGRQCQ